MTRTLAAVATQVQGRLIGADRGFGDVSTDTRTLGSGALFVAIVGERFDGNDFIAEAHSKGASGALVSRAASVPLPQIEVGDTRRALGGMARAWRENFDIPVVAVTGSAGKTTVKELIAAILGQRRPVANERDGPAMGAIEASFCVALQRTAIGCPALRPGRGELGCGAARPAILDHRDTL